MEIEIARQWLSVLIAIAALIWTVRQHFASVRKEELTNLKDRLTATEGDNRLLRERMGKAEEALKQLPDRDSVHELALKLAEISGDMKAMSVRVNAIGNTTERMDQYLMTAGQKP